MSFNSEELRTGYCSICNEKIGTAFNHDECAAIKKDIHKDENENKKPKKKISPKRAKEMAAYFSKIDW